MNVRAYIETDPAPRLPGLFAALAVRLDDADWSSLEETPFATLAERFALSEAESTLIALLAGGALSLDLRAALDSRMGPQAGIGAWFRLIPGLDWSSFAPTSVLRAWSLVTVHRAARFQDSQLSLDPRLLDWCLGTPSVDSRLLPYVGHLAPARFIAPSHDAAAKRGLEAFAELAQRSSRPLCCIVGDGASTRDRLASDMARALDMTPLALAVSLLEENAADRSLLLRLAARETILGRMLPMFAFRQFGTREADALGAAQGIALALTGSLEHSDALPRAIVVKLDPPDSAERTLLWRRHLPALDDHGALSLAENFAGSVDDIASVCDSLAILPEGRRADAAWHQARAVLAPPPDPLVLEIAPHATWHDLVLPAATEAALRALMAQSRHRATVYRRWGFADRMTRGLGITALFTGPSGTGKTLAAEAIAAELGQRLLRVNLAQVVDKYVGETEKHLDRIFALVERAGAIVLFDEADSLFAKRTDGDRNREHFNATTVAYLLQRLESCAATCILTTNLRGNIDEAFMRRLRFVVQFAFPGLAERRRLWRGAFPAAAPVGDLDFDLLATLPAAGGVIRNAAQNAAFFAADARRPIGMEHLLNALELENAKLVQPIDLGSVRRRLAP